MPRLLIVTAVAALLVAPVFAQDTSTPEPARPAAESTPQAQTPAPESSAPAVVTPARKTGCSHEKSINS